MHRNAGRLRDALAFSIEHACRIVEEVAHDARAARPPDRDAHFLGGRDERVAYDFQLDGIERFHGCAALARSSVGDQVAARRRGQSPARRDEMRGVLLLDDQRSGSRHRPRSLRASRTPSPHASAPGKHLAPPFGLASRAAVKRAFRPASPTALSPRCVPRRSPASRAVPRARIAPCAASWNRVPPHDGIRAAGNPSSREHLDLVGLSGIAHVEGAAAATCRLGNDRRLEHRARASRAEIARISAITGKRRRVGLHQAAPASACTTSE